MAERVGNFFLDPSLRHDSHQGLRLRAQCAPAHADAGLQGGLLQALRPEVGDGHRLVLFRQRLQSLHVRRQGLRLVAARVCKPLLALCEAYKGGTGES